MVLDRKKITKRFYFLVVLVQFATLLLFFFENLCILLITKIKNGGY
jgi:hypothetical protein